MSRFGNIPTQQEIDQLAERAEQGDPAAIKELGDLNNRLAKRANERLRYMERSGFDTTNAYQNAKYNIQTLADESGTRMDYFSQSKKLDPGVAADNLGNITAFLRSQTSTMRGEKARRE